MSIQKLEDRLNSTRKILSERTTVPELRTYLDKIDNYLYGIKRQQVTIVAGRTNIGKTPFVIQLAWNMAKDGKKVLFFSLEMSLESIVERIFCLEQEIDNVMLYKAEFHKFTKEWDLFDKKVRNNKFVASDITGKSWREVDETLNSLSVKPDIIFIDHINHIKTSHGKDKEAIDDYLLNMNAMAIKHNLAIVIVAQINRTSMDAKEPEPQLHQLKGSGCLEEVASVVLLLHWAHKYDNNKPKEEYDIFIAKNRSGATGRFKLRFDPHYGKFSDWKTLEQRHEEFIRKEKIYED